MRSVLLVSMIALCACAEAPKPPAPAPALQPTLSLKQVMEWVVDPAADAVWESVKTIITEKGTQEIAPQTQEQWEAVRTGAATLVEMSILLTTAARARDHDQWPAAARRLTATAEKALR